MKNEDEKWVFAVKHESEFYPERMDGEKDHILDNLEYADMKDGEYQLWHWPSGDIYDVVPDREVEARKEYSVPYDNTGVVWIPVLEKKGNNLDAVKDAVNRFTG